MKLSDKCSECVGAVVVGTCALAFGPGAAASGAVAAGVGAGTLGLLWLVGKIKHGPESHRTLKKIRQRIDKEWFAGPEFNHFDKQDLHLANTLLIARLPSVMLDRSQVAKSATSSGGGGFPSAATQLVIQALTELDGRFKTNSIVRGFTSAVIAEACLAAIDDRQYFEKIQPHLLLEMAKVGGETLQRLDNLEMGLALVPEQTAKMLSELIQNDLAVPTAESEMIEALARLLPSYGSDTDAMLVDLSFSIRAALELIERSKVRSNSAAKRQELFLELGEIMKGQGPASTLERIRDEYARWKVQEIERVAAEQAYSDNLIEFAITAAKAKSSAKEVSEFELLRLKNTSDSGDEFPIDSAIDIADNYLMNGRSDGNRLALLVASNIYAQAAQATSHNCSRSSILSQRSIAVWELGRLETANEMLEDAVLTSRNAQQLSEQDCDRETRSAVLSRLGVILRTLGARIESVPMLRDAAKTLSQAIELRPKARTPLHWAQSKSNLGNVYRDMAVVSNESKFYLLAMLQFKRAIRELTKHSNRSGVTLVKNNLALVYRDFGHYRSDEKMLRLAVTELDAVMENLGETLQPYYFAQALESKARCLMYLSRCRDDGNAELEQAQALVTQSLEGQRGIGANFFVKSATELLEEIDAEIALQE